MATIEMQWTEDLDKFKFVNYNRDVDQRRVDKILRVIQEDGFLVPILVNQDNIVVDGQHRLEACRRLKCKVAYITILIDDSKLPMVMSKLNATAKTWTDKNYFDMWLELKKESFVFIDEQVQKHNIQFQIAWQIILRLYIRRVEQRTKYKDGSFELTETQRTILVGKFAELVELTTLHERFNDFPKSFSVSMVSLITRKKYQHNVMLKALNSNPGFLLRAKTVKDFTIQLEDLYDRNVKSKKDKIGSNM